MFRRKPYSDMETPYFVHRGFEMCWHEIRDIIIAKVLEKYKNGNYRWRKVIIVGYSHGGALAMLAHEAVWFNRPDIRDDIKTIAFDGPRVYGWFWVKRSLKERWANFRLLRNSSDIVTHVPPAIFGYTHVGKIVKIGTDERFKIISNHTPAEIVESLNAYEHNEDWETALFE